MDNGGLEAAQEEFKIIYEETYKHASTPPNNADVDMEEDGDEEDVDDEPEFAPAEVVKPGGEEATTWYKSAKESLSQLEEIVLAITKPRTEVESITQKCGRGGSFLHTFFLQQKTIEEEELRTQEAALEVLQAKADKDLQAKEGGDQAAVDLQATEQALEEARLARDSTMASQKIKAEAAKIAHTDSMEE